MDLARQSVGAHAVAGYFLAQKVVLAALTQEMIGLLRYARPSPATMLANVCRVQTAARKTGSSHWAATRADSSP